jgi:hypothetical protein
MDTNLVYVKTPIGDEAIRQSTRVVKRNLRMILVQVDGKLTVAELSAKIGNRQLVEAALRELEADGYIAPTMEGVSVWEEGVRKAREQPIAPLSEFSTFGPAGALSADKGYSQAMASSFSTFGKTTQSRKPPSGEAFKRVEKSTAPIFVEQKTFVADRKPLPWARILLVGSLGVLLLGFLGLVFYPYDYLRPRIEAAASRYLQTPVLVGSVQLQLFPKPALILSNIKVGEKSDSSLERVSLPPLSLLGSGQLEIERVDVYGASFAVNNLLKFPGFGLTARNADSHLAVKRFVIDRLSVSAGDLMLDGLQGEISNGSDGLAKKVEFQTVDRNIRLSAVPAPSGLLLNIEGFGWKPFPNALISFDSLQAKGLLQPGKLVIQSFDTTLLGGIVKGSWLLDWSSGLTMAGDASLARLDARRIGTAFVPKLAIEGEVSGVLRLRGSGVNSSAMWHAADGSMDMTVTNGAVHGVDLGEAMRRGAGSTVRGGATKFERLTGTLNITEGKVLGRVTQLDAGMMLANGQFSVMDQRVEAAMTVTMQTSVSTQRLPVRVSGVIPDLSSMAGR